MSDPEYFPIRPFTEADIDALIECAGGARAHSDADSRSHVGGDYKLGGALIELKALDEDGFSKEERQRKLSALFQQYAPNKPVIVLDRRYLKGDDKKKFDRIVETPIKSAVKKASNQLKQSRVEFPESNCSVLMVLNNSYMALDHEMLIRLVEHRVRQDTSQIDAIVVAGIYYHSDGRECYMVTPIECVSVNKRRAFAEFEQLKNAWSNFCDRFIEELAINGPSCGRTKAPINDIQFECEGVTYIWPAPAIGGTSDFYPQGRPRKDSIDRPNNTHIAITLPLLSEQEWTRLGGILTDSSHVIIDYDVYKKRQQQFSTNNSGKDTLPLVWIPIEVHAWKTWCLKYNRELSERSMSEFANEIFGICINRLTKNARKLGYSIITPSRFVLAHTEIIGKDKANDVSHICIVNEMLVGNAKHRMLVENARIPHEHAIALAAAYAVREKIGCVMWSIDTKYAWY